uniref:Gag protein n=1 Tax=Panagrolaimus superbus TaxID=310955 RepID=A0A914ZBD8_9BILA
MAPTTTTPAVSPTAIDPQVLATAIAAALQHLNATQPNQSNISRQLPNIPTFTYDPAKPNGAALWFQQLDSLFRLQTITDPEKCALATNALDSSTFEKVAHDRSV